MLVIIIDKSGVTLIVSRYVHGLKDNKHIIVEIRSSVSRGWLNCYEIVNGVKVKRLLKD